MPYSQGIVTAPIRVADVQSAVSIGSGDVGTLCKSPNMNPFARWKPFRYNSLYLSTPASRLAAAKAMNYGTNIISCGRVDFATKYTQQWSHLAPRGANGGGQGYNEHYRLTDFENYQSRRWQLGQVAGGKGLYTIFNGYMQIPSTLVSDLDVLSFVMQCAENDDVFATVGLLYPNDFAGATKDFSQYYLGIAILEDRTNGKLWVYSDQKVSNFTSGVNVTTGIYPRIPTNISNGSIKIAPILAQYRTLDSSQIGWTDGYNGDIIILNGAYLPATKVAQAHSFFTEVTVTVYANKVKMEFVIENNTGASVTVNNLVCYLLSAAAESNEPDAGYNAPDRKGMGAPAYISSTWPQNYKSNDIYLHDWTGEPENPDPLAARFYNAYQDFYARNGNTNLVAANARITWDKEIYQTQDGFGAYSNGAWALFCISITGDSFVRSYPSY